MLYILGYIFGGAFWAIVIFILILLLIDALWAEIMFVIATILSFVMLGITAIFYYSNDCKLRDKYRMYKEKCFSTSWLVISILQGISVTLCSIIPLALESSPIIPLIITAVIYLGLSYYVISRRCKKLDAMILKYNQKKRSSNNDYLKKEHTTSQKKTIARKSCYSAPSMPRRASSQRQDWRKHKELWENYPEPDYDATHTYCKVAFEDLDRTFYYRTRNPNLKIGDKVIVPFGKDLNAKEGMIVSIKNYKGIDAPYPLEKTKYIIDKVNQ